MRDLFDTFPLPTIVVDKNFSILNVNESGLDFLGTNLKTVFSKNITSIFPHLDSTTLTSKEYFEVLYRDAFGRNKTLSVQFCSYIKDDVYGFFYINQAPFPNSTSHYTAKKSKVLIHKLHVFESLVNQINKGIFIFNESGQLIYLNKIAANRFELKNKKIKNFYSWQLFDFFGEESQWDATKKNLKSQNEIVHTIHKFDPVINKTRALAIVASERLIDNQNYYVVTFSDITAIEKDKFEINEKENHLNLFHKNIPAAIYEFVISGKSSYFNYISNAFQKIFDFEIAINDKKWNSEIKLHPVDFLEFITSINEIKDTISEFKFIGRFLFRGDVIWFETNATVTQKKDLIFLNGTILNITERIKNEEEVLKNKKFNDSILYNIPADIAVFDEDHNYQFINSNGITNRDVRDWMIGKNDFDYCHLKGLDTLMAEERHGYFVQAKASKESVDWIDQITKAGKKIYIYRRFFPVYNNDEFIYMIGYGIDVTLLKETQLQLEQQNKILTNKNQELERFTYIASHDLQEPLLSLISFSELLEEEYSAALGDEGQLFVQFINKSATRMRSLITGLMEYNRINMKEALNSFDFNILIKEVREDLSLKINKHQAIISVEDLPTLPCYPTFIRILFQNLISNAIKFTTNEVIPIIKISCKEREEDWLFQVADNGIGINAKNLEEIFMIFKRLHKEENYVGHGIGLAHCKKIVEIHNGDIWVESKEGVGSVFNFTISKHI